jgi:DNA transposition AAA+ family ATPase
MSRNGNIVNFPASATVAPIANVSKCMTALRRAMNRPSHLPGLVTFYGPSGWGKSTAAAYTANKHRAYYVEAKSSWTRKALLLAVCKEMGIVPAKTIYEMTEQVSEQLVLSGRPLIVDEMDHLVERNAVEVLRDLYEGSNAAILLIGEERLPAKLKAWERFHGRVLEWVPAEPASLDDAEHLAGLYSSDIAIGADLLEHIHQLAQGSIRRICVNIDLVRTEAQREGWDEITLATWGERRLYTGDAPARRV